MLVEHIIEPEFLVELAKSKRNCRDFVREFSKPSPRVIGDFPKFRRLRRAIFSRQAIDASELEKSRLDELVRMIDSSNHVCHSIVYNGEKPFIENLVDIESISNCHICLLKNAETTLPITSRILSVREFDEGISSLPYQIQVPKIASEISCSLSGFIRLSSSITIVDPYFSTNPGVWNTFLSLLNQAVVSSVTPPKKINILFDGSKTSARSCDFLANKIKTEEVELIEQFAQITFMDIRENGNEAIHNRYIISELAAVGLPYGLQETNEHESDDFSLLSDENYQLRYSQYVELTGVCLAGKCCVKSE